MLNMKKLRFAAEKNDSHLAGDILRTWKIVVNLLDSKF